MNIKAKGIVRKVAIALVLLCAVTLSAYWGVQQTESFKVAKAYVLEEPEVTRLGIPVAATLRFFGYSMKVSDTNGSAEFAFIVQGTSGRAVARVRLKKGFGGWSVIDSQVIQS
ncbi:MAG: hypothetical protein QM661_13005 [Solimonas sp.]